MGLYLVGNRGRIFFELGSCWVKVRTEMGLDGFGWVYIHRNPRTHRN